MSTVAAGEVEDLITSKAINYFLQMWEKYPILIEESSEGNEGNLNEQHKKIYFCFLDTKREETFRDYFFCRLLLLFSFQETSILQSTLCITMRRLTTHSIQSHETSLHFT